MAGDETSPLLSTSAKSRTDAARSSQDSGETAPLLSGDCDTPRYDGEQDEPSAQVASSIRSRHDDAVSTTSAKKPRRWPSLIAMGILAALTVATIVLAFVIPDVVQEYAKQAAVVEPTNLSLESITANGIRARIQATLRLDASRVRSDDVRRLGRAATFVANQLGIQETRVDVYLPDYDNILLGAAVVPPLVINLRDGRPTRFDFVTEISAGDVEAFRAVANEWLDGRLDRLRLRGKADLSLKSGIIPLGTHVVSELLVVEANSIPEMPQYNITRLMVEDMPAPGGRKSLVAEAILSAYNKYPVELDVPELAFEILVAGCDRGDPFITVADAITSEVLVKPRSNVAVGVHGLIQKLPESLTHDCPHSHSSPLDILLEQYMHGERATLFVRGHSHPDGDTPGWVAEILSSITLPVPFPGRTFDSLIRHFSLTDVHFTLPSPAAEPGDPEADPKVSGKIQVTAGVPSQMNFDIDVTRIRADADIFYNSRLLGELNLRKWQLANSTRTPAEDDREATLLIESQIDNAPLNVTDSDVLGDVIQALVFGGKPVLLDIKAAVDVKIATALGQMIVKDVPAEGKIPVKPLPGTSLGSIAPKLGSIRVLDTTSTSITLATLLNVSNPTPYTAHVPYMNIHILHNDTVLGEGIVENVDIVRGSNTNIPLAVKWDPKMGGEGAKHVGRELISRYLSGFNTSIAVKAHRKSFPGQPILCEALEKFNITFPTPRLSPPADTPDEKARFIRDATFHLLSSTATFTLVSPLHFNTFYLDFVNATALYNHTQPVGKIVYDLPFEAPPGKSTTPKLPVDWNAGSVGHAAVRKALGGSLQLSAAADVDVRLGNWVESIWYTGEGIGVGVRL